MLKREMELSRRLSIEKSKRIETASRKAHNPCMAVATVFPFGDRGTLSAKKIVLALLTEVISELLGALNQQLHQVIPKQMMPRSRKQT